MEDEPRPKRFSATPLIGFMIAVILSIVGWLIAPDTLHWLSATLPNFAGNALPLSITRPLFTAILVILALIVFGLVAALIAPKNAHSARDSSLERERDALRRRQKAQRDQARKGKGRTPWQ